MKRLFWSMVHLLPWAIVRRVCDMCRELPFDPKRSDEWFADNEDVYDAAVARLNTEPTWIRSDSVLHAYEMTTFPTTTTPVTTWTPAITTTTTYIIPPGNETA